MPPNSIKNAIKEWSKGKPTLDQEVQALRANGGDGGPATEPDWAICPLCHERRFHEPPVPPEIIGRIMCGCNRPLPPAQNFDRMFSNSGLPERVFFCSVKPTPARLKAREFCKTLISDGCGWVSMYGDVGGGKTHLALATA